MDTVYELNGNKLILGDCTIYNNMELFKEMHVKTVVCVKDYGFKLDYLRNNGINVIDLHLSHRKLYNKKIMKKAIMLTNKFIDDGLEKGSVYVHCRSGKNRSPVFIASYLVYREGLTPDLAYRYVKDKCSLVKKTYLNVFKSIYTD